MTDLPTRARALIEAGERAKTAKKIIQFGPSDAVLAYLERTSADAPDIARAYLEALAIVRKMLYANYLERPGAIADARAWVEKQEG